MSTTEEKLTDADVARAEEIWRGYQRTHDVSARKGQAVGIDPHSGRVWFGEDALDIYDQMKAAGCFAPIYCVRVGYDYYGRKGGRQ